MTLTTLKQQVVDYLKGWVGLVDVLIQPSFPGSAYQHPVNHSQIFVGLHRVSLKPAGFGQLFGQQGNTTISGLWGEVTFSFHCQVPNNHKEMDCHLLLEQLSQALVESGFGFLEIWCQEIKGDTKGFSNQLICYATLRTSIESQIPYQPIHDLIVKGGYDHAVE